MRTLQGKQNASGRVMKENWQELERAGVGGP
jgi:hypothetical protein